MMSIVNQNDQKCLLQLINKENDVHQFTRHLLKMHPKTDPLHSFPGGFHDSIAFIHPRINQNGIT